MQIVNLNQYPISEHCGCEYALWILENHRAYIGKCGRDFLHYFWFFYNEFSTIHKAFFRGQVRPRRKSLFSEAKRGDHPLVRKSGKGQIKHFRRLIKSNDDTSIHFALPVSHLARNNYHIWPYIRSRVSLFMLHGFFLEKNAWPFK